MGVAYGIEAISRIRLLSLSRISYRAIEDAIRVNLPRGQAPRLPASVTGLAPLRHSGPGLDRRSSTLERFGSSRPYLSGWALMSGVRGRRGFVQTPVLTSALAARPISSEQRAARSMSLTQFTREVKPRGTLAVYSVDSPTLVEVASAIVIIRAINSLRESLPVVGGDSVQSTAHFTRLKQDIDNWSDIYRYSGMNILVND